ncbi:MAG: sigma-70 family RNA polymerase sigma factor [Planctomycetes bacterium]|nr:sigma-70 family RNA polymerase sigma factor [Planctomycetota bacterium]
MTNPTDTEELLVAARAGDPASLSALLEQHRARLLLRIRLMMGEKARRIADSEDFAQAVLTDAASGLPKFEPRGPDAFLRWLTVIARNRIRSAVRRHREESLDTFVLTGLSAGSGPSTAAELSELRERVVDALAAMSDDHRRAIELRQFDGLPFAAIGERLGRSENAAQLLFTRALVELGARLGRTENP